MGHHVRVGCGYALVLALGLVLAGANFGGLLRAWDLANPTTLASRRTHDMTTTPQRRKSRRARRARQRTSLKVATDHPKLRQAIPDEIRAPRCDACGGFNVPCGCQSDQ